MADRAPEELVRDAAWQLNEALSMLREAAAHTNTDPRESWVEDFRAGEDAMHAVLERLAGASRADDG